MVRLTIHLRSTSQWELFFNSNELPTHLLSKTEYIVKPLLVGSSINTVLLKTEKTI